jgi:SAM-dependent methyltransferase
MFVPVAATSPFWDDCHLVLARLTNPIWKLVAFLYYRSFGEPSAFARWAAPRVRAWEERTARGDAPLPAETWEGQYRDGRWDYLAGEVERYRGLADLVASHCRHPAILDAGCGDGLLVEALRKNRGYSHYLGLDLSELAVERAQRFANPTTRFLAADAEKFAAGERFDAIVFNESLYYFEDPLGAAERYRSLLELNGLFILSMFGSQRSLAILRALRQRYRVVEERLQQGQRGTWHQVVLDPL